MPKLCDIVKPGVSCRVRSENGETYVWNGRNLIRDVHEHLAVAHLCLVFDDDWQLDEPTVESVLKERGYECRSSNWDWDIGFDNGRVWFRCEYDKRPTTAAQINAICDLLDGYR